MDAYRGGLVSIEREPQRNTLRSFGLALALVCFARAAWSCTYSACTTAIVTSCMGLALAAIALQRPSMLRWPFVLLGVVSFPVRWLLSFSVLAVLYFVVITPIACGVRVARRLRTREQTLGSEWRVSPARGDKPSYFRQF